MERIWYEEVEIVISSECHVIIYYCTIFFLFSVDRNIKE